MRRVCFIVSQNRSGALAGLVTSSAPGVGETGLEPATPGPPDQYSNHLSYSPIRLRSLAYRRVQTSDLLRGITAHEIRKSTINGLGFEQHSVHFASDRHVDVPLCSKLHRH